MKSAKINSFQGLRAIAFIGVFLTHSSLGNLFALGAWGVSVFFIMSGFLMMLSNLNKQERPKFSFGFAWNKVRSLYPLHIVTMLLCAVYAQHFGENIVRTVMDMGLHSSLLQIWIPNASYYSTLNSVAWYLCVSFFLYLCFPLIFRFSRKHLNERRVYIALFSMILLQLLVSVVAFYVTQPNSFSWFNTQWLVYYFPPTRLIDFAAGCFIGYLYFFKKHNCPSVGKSPRILIILLEFMVCVAIVFAWYIHANNYSILGSHAIKYSSLFMPINIYLIWLIANKEGVLWRILSLKPLVRLGDLTPYAFLIHMVVLRYCYLLFDILGHKHPVLIAGTSFVLTILFSLTWKYFWKYAVLPRE